MYGYSDAATDVAALAQATGGLLILGSKRITSPSSAAPGVILSPMRTNGGFVIPAGSGWLWA